LYLELLLGEYASTKQNVVKFSIGVEINQALIEGLVDTDISMLVMVANVMRELCTMHPVSGHETYKTTSSMII
jgi:hypothetical protein